MKLKVLSKPNTLNESAALIGKTILHSKGEKINLLKEPEKYGLTELDLYKRYGDFIEYSLDLYNTVHQKIEKLEVLHPYLKLNDSKFLPEIVIHNEPQKIEDFNFESFKIGALRAFKNLEIMDGTKSLDQLDIEAKEFIKSGMDLGEILNAMDSMDLEPDEKLLYLDFFNNLEEIYIGFKELLSFSHDIYIKNYYKVEKYVERNLNRLKVDGEYPKDTKDLYISQLVDIDKIRIGEDEIFYYYISTIQYNSISMTISSNDNIPAVGMEGVLFYELSDLKEKEGFKSHEIKEQLSALGDSTRFDIINLLNKKSYYLKELADALNLTSPTVSHHMDELLQASLIKITTKGRRIYYSLNRESIRGISEFFSKF